MSATNLKTRTGIATRVLAGVSVPDTPVISRAIEFAREQSEPYLFNHAMRSWLFASIIAVRNKTVHDSEVLAVTTILHDLGLAEHSTGRSDLKWRERMQRACSREIRALMIARPS
jgi:HD superfamily phosphodiesterase